ncbi:hypothetical protein F2Q68_00014513 [Brassica cretica]|uniref:Arabidopsis retrotransposon Orf1 C-terminal domain-containing protein n=1 Tax=Brassica cretica TaxID=69181 RepID=A0A8S9HBX9_BRACR|nr:hypothetical protein F2Q68_00014513 [Brassica cretica]
MWQQALAAKKRDGKRVVTAEGVDASGRRSASSKRSKEPKDKGIALPQEEKNEDITEGDQAPLKKAKVSKGKKVDTERDRTKISTEDELYGHLKNGVLWPPTRFADIKIMEELEIEATFHTTKHVRQGWGKIKFKIRGKVYYMTFKEIGQAFGLKDLEESYIPIPYDATREENIAKMVWKVLAGKSRKASRDKNASIRHPSVRYLHRLIVHTIFPRKEAGTVNDEELQLLHQTVQHYAHPSQLPLVSTDFYKNFGVVGFFVKRLIHYKEWAWTTSDSEPQIGIDGLITPLLKFKDISLEDDPIGPAFMDGSYLKKAQYFSGRFEGTYVYSYLQSTKELLYGPPRYHFEQRPGALPNGPLCQAHEHIGNLQRWNRAQDRTIFKLKAKCKELSKTVKRQAEASAQFMKKVADILTRGAVAGCSSSDFDFLTPQPQPPIDPLALSFPATKKQLLRRKRNPPAQPSDSGNNEKVERDEQKSTNRKENSRDKKESMKL